jgi:hypothetical protein
MFLIRADHPHHAAAADDLALVTNPFDRRPNFHKPLVASGQLPAASKIVLIGRQWSF